MLFEIYILYMEIKPEWLRAPPEYLKSKFDVENMLKSKCLDLKSNFWMFQQPMIEPESPELAVPLPIIGPQDP